MRYVLLCASLWFATQTSYRERSIPEFPKPPSEPVVRFRSSLGGTPQKLHQSGPGGVASALLEEVSRSFYHSHFLSHRHRDPLVERNTIFLGQPLRGFLDGKRKFQRISSFAHAFTFFNKSPGRNTESLKRSPASAKSLMLYVTSTSAWPLIAASSTISSFGSRDCGRHW